MGNSLGCSPSGERLVSAARDGDLQEAQALLDFNPRLAKYSTFGVRNSPIHFAAAQGHNEIVSLLLESGVEVNVRNYSGQTALMQACRNGHWEVVQTLILFKANVNRADYLNGRTALHFAAVNGHARCIRLLFADYFPSSTRFLTNDFSQPIPEEGSSVKAYLNRDATLRIVNRPADGGITALHMAALNGHAECVLLLLDLMADVSAVTVQDGTTIDLIGIGSTALHYAACGGNTACCQILISRGASRSVQNSNGWTPLDVARLWRRNWLEPLLSQDSETQIPPIPPSRYLALPLMSIVRIARECGWRSLETCAGGADACAVCLERKCTVAAEGCGHELCTKCALYLCSTSNASSNPSAPPGSIPCPLCRHDITSFVKLPTTPIIRDFVKSNLSLSLCTVCSTQVAEPMTLSGPISRLEQGGCSGSPESSGFIRTINCTTIPGLNLPFTCHSDPDDDTPRVHRSNSVKLDRKDQCLWLTPRNSLSSRSQIDGRWWFQNMLPAVT